MKIKEAVKLYREYKKIDAKEFGITVFISEERVKKIEESENEVIDIDDLLKLYQFFSTSISTTDSRELHIKSVISHLLVEEIRKRTEAS